jgi:hypothetical protein
MMKQGDQINNDSGLKEGNPVAIFHFMVYSAQHLNKICTNESIVLGNLYKQSAFPDILMMKRCDQNNSIVYSCKLLLVLRFQVTNPFYLGIRFISISLGVACRCNGQ